jgi:acyl-CoA reductase-like NAD-dependent aldehyde dehydrogenase
MDVGVPLGVICALVPSTNPTSTVIYKALIALKAGNAIIFSRIRARVSAAGRRLRSSNARRKRPARRRAASTASPS